MVALVGLAREDNHHSAAAVDTAARAVAESSGEVVAVAGSKAASRVELVGSPAAHDSEDDKGLVVAAVRQLRRTALEEITPAAFKRPSPLPNTIYPPIIGNSEERNKPTNHVLSA